MKCRSPGLSLSLFPFININKCSINATVANYGTSIPSAALQYLWMGLHYLLVSVVLPSTNFKFPPQVDKGNDDRFSGYKRAGLCRILHIQLCVPLLAYHTSTVCCKASWIRAHGKVQRFGVCWACGGLVCPHLDTVQQDSLGI